MAGGNAIRGSRVGAGPMGEKERGETAPRQRVSFFCANGHEVRPAFAVDAALPDTWDCPKCGFPGRPGLGRAAERAAQRAVQDPPRVREGAPLGRRRRRPARRGAGQAEGAPRRELSRSSWRQVLVFDDLPPEVCQGVVSSCTSSLRRFGIAMRTRQRHTGAEPHRRGDPARARRAHRRATHRAPTRSPTAPCRPNSPGRAPGRRCGADADSPSSPTRPRSARRRSRAPAPRPTRGWPGRGRAGAALDREADDEQQPRAEALHQRVDDRGADQAARGDARRRAGRSRWRPGRAARRRR